MFQRALLAAVFSAGLLSFQAAAGETATHPKPIIGISIDNSDHATAEATKLGMINEVQLAGGVPLILNDRMNRTPEKDIGQIDGLIVQGDPKDVDPAMYGQAKDKTTDISTDKSRTDYENKIIVDALHAKVPVLLVCGGMQRANVLMGGTLYQNIPDLSGVKPGHGNNNGKPGDTPSVTIAIKPDSNFAKILGKNEVMVNSFHHQALDKIASGFRVVAYSDAYTRKDGGKGHLVEAIEADPTGQFAGQYIVGLQFHPEIMPGSDLTNRLFGSFAHAAQKFAVDNNRTHPDEDILRKVSQN